MSDALPVSVTPWRPLRSQARQKKSGVDQNQTTQLSQQRELNMVILRLHMPDLAECWSDLRH